MGKEFKTPMELMAENSLCNALNNSVYDILKVKYKPPYLLIEDKENEQNN